MWGLSFVRDIRKEAFDIGLDMVALISNRPFPFVGELDRVAINLKK